MKPRNLIVQLEIDLQNHEKVVNHRKRCSNKYGFLWKTKFPQFLRTLLSLILLTISKILGTFNTSAHIFVQIWGTLSFFEWRPNNAIMNQSNVCHIDLWTWGVLSKRFNIFVELWWRTLGEGEPDGVEATCKWTTNKLIAQKVDIIN